MISNLKNTIQLDKSQKFFLKKFENELEQFSTLSTSCGLCKTQNYLIISNYDRYNIKMDYGVCKNCGLIQSIKKFSFEDYKNFYENYYAKIYKQSDNDDPETFFESRKQIGTRLLKLISSKIKLIPNSKILEVGCGSGGILHPFFKSGYEVKGIDLNVEDLKYGRKRGLNLSYSSIEHLKLDEKFNLIISMRSLEHVSKPNEFLKQIKKHLAIDGSVFIGVPSLNSLFDTSRLDRISLKKQLHFAHIFFFSKRSLTNLMVINNYDKVFINNSIESIWKVSNNKIPKIDKTNFYITFIQLFLINNLRYVIFFKNYVKLLIKDFLKKILKQ